MTKQTSRFLPFISAGLVASSLIFSGCGKDDESIKPKVEFPDEYSEFSVEENKQNIQDNGLAMVDDMNDLKDTPGISTTVNLIGTINASPLPNSGRQVTDSRVFSLLNTLAKFGEGKASGSDVLKSMRVKDHTNPETLQEDFDAHAGTYKYSIANESWTFTEGSGSIIFEFPATETATTNNAKLSITDFSTNEVTEDGEVIMDLPKSVKADLSVNGQSQLQYSFAASYKSNGDPTSVNTSLTVGAFKFSFSAKNTTSEVAADYALTKNGQNVLSFGAGASGNFSTSNEAEETSDIVKNGSAYFQIKNIKFAGKVNVATLESAMENAETIDEEADAYTEATEFIVFYADTKKKIADTEFYGTVKTDTYEDCWDSNGNGFYDQGECQTWSETYEAVDIRLVFEDDSRVDLATYIEEGFEELETSLENLIDDLEEDLG